jgi:hypothetical protein
VTELKRSKTASFAPTAQGDGRYSPPSREFSRAQVARFRLCKQSFVVSHGTFYIQPDSKAINFGKATYILLSPLFLVGGPGDFYATENPFPCIKSDNAIATLQLHDNSRP